jgi:hypothetical protein
MHKGCGFENFAKLSSFCKKLVKFALEKQKNQKHLSLSGKKFPNKTLSPTTHKRNLKHGHVKDYGLISSMNKKQNDYNIFIMK